MSGGETPRLRRAARALVLSHDGHLLLMQMQLPWRPRPVWITPGGGIEAGETARDAVVRELREETGLQIDAPGPLVWERQVSVDAPAGPLLQHESYFLVRTERFEPRALALAVEDEAQWFLAHRWWPVAALPEHSPDFAPTGIGAGVATLLRCGAPERVVQMPR